MPNPIAIACALVALTSAAAPSHSHVQEGFIVSASSPDTAKDDSEIRALITGQADAWNRHDAKGWAAPFLPSAEFINILGTPFSGKAAVEGITARIFASIFKDSRDSVTVRKIVHVRPDVAVVHYEHAVSNYTALPPGIQASEVGADGKGVLRTLMVYVLLRDARGKWMIVNGQNTAILPPLTGR